MPHDPIVIVSAKRTPMGHFQGIFKDIPSPQLGGHAISAAISSVFSSSQKIDGVIMGCVLSAGLGQAPARQAALFAGLSHTTPCVTVNKMCGSGMQAVMLAHREIATNQAEIMIAGGMENMSCAPYLLPGARFGYRIGAQQIEDHMMIDGLLNAYGDHASMGMLAENCVKKFGFTREAQDAYALDSLKRAQFATQSGFFKDEITPITISDKKGDKIIFEDEGIQKGMPEKIPQLKPAFLKEGTITAANSSSISDGAATLILMRESLAKKLKIAPLVKIIADHTVAQEPEWFSTAPIVAIEQLLKKINWQVNEVDLFEVNEAFAAVTMATEKTLRIPHEKMNVHGGACVLGHPIGASGARILVTLIHALKKYGKKRGVAALCIGGGEATAMAIEIV